SSDPAKSIVSVSCRPIVRLLPYLDLVGGLYFPYAGALEGHSTFKARLALTDDNTAILAQIGKALDLVFAQHRTLRFEFNEFDRSVPSPDGCIQAEAIAVRGDDCDLGLHQRKQLAQPPQATLLEQPTPTRVPAHLLLAGPQLLRGLRLARLGGAG